MFSLSRWRQTQSRKTVEQMSKGRGSEASSCQPLFSLMQCSGPSAKVGPLAAVSLQSLVLMCLLSWGPPSDCGNASVVTCSRRAGWAPASTRPVILCAQHLDGGRFCLLLSSSVTQKTVYNINCRRGGVIVSRDLCPELALAECRPSGPGHKGKVGEC